MSDFYLLKLEAIRIGDSEPAPLLTLISGPSEDSRRVGETKKELSERHIVRKTWWTQLLAKAKPKTKLHANISPGKDNWVSAGAGKSGLAYNYFVLQHRTGIELYIDTGNKDENKMIFDGLHRERNAIESIFGKDIAWERLDNKRACRIAKYYDGGGYSDSKEEWPKLQDRLIDAMISFHKAISPYLKQ